MFVNGAPVPITEGENTIFIRPKMDFGTRNACMDALMVIRQADGGRADMAAHVGAYQLALLQHNITGWSGPDFQGVPCSPDMIARLDPDEPLVERVLEEIGQRNPLREEPPAEKKDVTSAGGRRSKASRSNPASGTPT